MKFAQNSSRFLAMAVGAIAFLSSCSTIAPAKQAEKATHKAKSHAAAFISFNTTTGGQDVGAWKEIDVINSNNSQKISVTYRLVQHCTRFNTDTSVTVILPPLGSKLVVHWFLIDCDDAVVTPGDIHFVP